MARASDAGEDGERQEVAREEVAREEVTREDAVDPADGTWTIAEIAQEFDVTHRTIRYYEDKGLVSPERRGTQRVFHPRDRVRLGLVLRGRRLGFPLDEIATIVDMYDQTPGEAGQLRYVLGQIDERRADLEQRRADIEAALAELDGLQRRCSSQLAELEASAQRPDDARPPDLPPATSVLTE